ncbi:rRNA maturation RNase YbeY [bacterium]|nr:rRNA maturation RNase YbeY [bacterium]MBQ6436270.1 rRNA maturation RNase YbeY [bacterium]
MITINLLVNSRFLVDRKMMRQRATAFLQAHQIEAAIVDVHIVGSHKIKKLNEQIGHEGVTDVLSFPQYDPQEENFALPPGVPRHLGDIVINYAEAVNQARKRGKLVDEQIWFYLEHGLLHLLGYHHNDGMEDTYVRPKIKI